MNGRESNKKINDDPSGSDIISGIFGLAVGGIGTYLYMREKEEKEEKEDFNHKTIFETEDNEIIKLIDLENVGIGNYKKFRKFNNAYIVGFISRNNLNNVPKYTIDNIESIMELEIYEGTQREGADVSLILYIGKHMETLIRNRKEIHIYSKDKIFIPLIDILLQKKIKCKIINNYDDESNDI